MADRTFTEGEAYALVADAVERETASAKAATATALEQVTAISNEKDALELRATAAEEAKAAAEKALADYKDEVETQKAQEAKRTERVAALADVAPTLKIEGERAERIVAMTDEHFTEYLAGLREVAAMGPHAFKADPDGDGDKCVIDGKGKSDPIHVAKQKAAVEGEIPRQSAAFKGSEGGTKPTGAVSTLFAARQALAAKNTA